MAEILATARRPVDAWAVAGEVVAPVRTPFKAGEVGPQATMMYPLVRGLAAPTARLRVPVTVTCRKLGFSSKASTSGWGLPLALH
ncbi:MAG: hypothetical protein LH461_03130 [Spirochaetaceae bacterium]|nr:hypothetical protein [Spirochaetaceae bacterium]